MAESVTEALPRSARAAVRPRVRFRRCIAPCAVFKRRRVPLRLLHTTLPAAAVAGLRGALVTRMAGLTRGRVPVLLLLVRRSARAGAAGGRHVGRLSARPRTTRPRQSAAGPTAKGSPRSCSGIATSATAKSAADAQPPSEAPAAEAAAKPPRAAGPRILRTPTPGAASRMRARSDGRAAVNRVQLKGNIGASTDVTTLGKGRVARFSLAFDEWYKRSTGATVRRAALSAPLTLPTPTRQASA